MSQFDVHTEETASSELAKLLTFAEKAYGFIPIFLGVMAESPVVLDAYLTTGQLFEEPSISPIECQVLMLTTNRFNECNYCMAAPSVIGGMQNVAANVIGAIRNDRPIDDRKLEALRLFTIKALEKRGWLSAADIAEFLAAGYTKAQVIEVILGISFMTLSNYVNHIANMPLDDAFAALAWTPAVPKV